MDSRPAWHTALTPRSPLPAEDLHNAIRWAVEREGLLFAAGERVVLDRILALSEPAAELYARLSLRVGAIFRVATLAYACASLESVRELGEAGLVTFAVPDVLAIQAFSADALREACARLGLAKSGPRATLEARLVGTRWREESVILLLHRGLLARVDRLGGFDRALAPVDRIVGTIWADYVPTGGTGAFRSRREMDLWERARRGDLALDEAVAVALAGPPAWGNSPFEAAVESLLAANPSADQLARIPGCAIPHVRALEAEGRVEEAVARCRRGDENAEVALALARTGKRLARTVRAPWPPVPPPTAPPSRRVWFAPAPTSGSRPLWRVGETDLTIEAAVVAALELDGRTAIHGENWLWTSAFALVFRDLYWLPLAGQLPTARRSGPLDLGTPAFYEARRSQADACISRLQHGTIAEFVEAWHGERLDGLVRAEAAIAVLTRLNGAFIAAVLSRFLRLGWAAARGLPDLLVLPGPPLRLARAMPSVLPESAFFAEIKGPTDTVRDSQRLWHEHLLKQQIHVEIWNVE